VPERHPWVEGLNWGAWIGRAAWETPPAGGVGGRGWAGPADEVLLWREDVPLLWRRPGPRREARLVLNVRWGEGNEARMPAWVLMLRRFVLEVRDAQDAPYAAMFDAGAPVSLGEAALAPEAAGGVSAAGGAGGPGGAGAVAGSGALWELESEGAGERRVLEPAERAVLRAPEEPGFFTVWRDGEARVRGAAQFADARQGDLRAAQAFLQPPPGAEADGGVVDRRHLSDDPWTVAWLALAAGGLLLAWWPAGASAGGGVGAVRDGGIGGSGAAARGGAR
jgi:hypothetical protein